MTPFLTDLPLDSDELQRYSRQILLPEWGVEAQRRLRQSTVLVVGTGGLGSPSSLYLAAAGVGRLILVDFDRVEETNLQRQVLFSSADVGVPKLVAAAARLRALNPRVELELVDQPFGPANARQLVTAADVVVDGTDNFPARYLVNDACVLVARPNVFGSIQRFEGQAAVFAAPGGPCYRCLHPEPPPEGAIPSCAEGGVLGVLPGVIGTIQATEVLKLVSGIGTPLVGRFLLYDALTMRIRDIALPRDPDCPVCGDAPSILDLHTYEQACAPAEAGEEISVVDLRAWRAARRPHVLVDVREPDEHARGAISGAVLLPLGTLDRHLSTLPTGLPVVVHCRTGQRSRRGAAILRRAGFAARSLTGGIEAWLRSETEPRS